MAFKYNGVDVANPRWNGTDILIIRRNGQEIWRRSILGFDGPNNVTHTIPFGEALQNVGIKIIPSGAFNLFYGRVVGQGSYGEVSIPGGEGRWTSNILTSSEASQYEVSFSTASGYTPITDIITHHVNTTYNVNTGFTVWIRKRSDTDDSITRAFRVLILR